MDSILAEHQVLPRKKAKTKTFINTEGSTSTSTHRTHINWELVFSSNSPHEHVTSLCLLAGIPSVHQQITPSPGCEYMRTASLPTWTVTDMSQTKIELEILFPIVMKLDLHQYSKFYEDLLLVPVCQSVKII